MAMRSCPATISGLSTFSMNVSDNFMKDKGCFENSMPNTSGAIPEFLH